MTDEVARLLAAFGERGKPNQSAWKLDVLMSLVGLDDPRIVAFLTDVLADDAEPIDVRTAAVQGLRAVALAPDQRVAVAGAGRRVLCGPAGGDLRPQLALLLGDFADVPGVVAALGARATDADEPFELRYSAFIALQQAGPTPESLALLGALSDDEMLGPSARSLMATWGAA